MDFWTTTIRDARRWMTIERLNNLYSVRIVHRYRATSHRKVRNSVRVGPPNWTKSRTFVLRFQLVL